VSTRKTGESIIKFELGRTNTLAVTSGNTIEFERKREFSLPPELLRKNIYHLTGRGATRVRIVKNNMFVCAH
jgi:hypothetical protein